MISKYRKVRIEDIVETVNTGLDAIRRAPIVSYPTDLKCLRIQDISQNKTLDKWGFTEVREADYVKYKLRKGEIIIARTGATIGVNFYVEKDLNAVFNNGLARIRVKKSKIDPKFLYYVLQTSNFKNHIKSISSGTSAQPNMKVGDLKKFEFNLPPKNIQKSISNFLFSIDKKIDLYKTMNETLKDISTTLFKSWFVNFDPVKENSEKKNTNLLEGINVLFPDSFESSELGTIPKDWVYGNLGNLFEPKRGKIITKSKTQPGNVPVVAGGKKPAYYHSESNVESPVVTISASGTAGYVNLYYEDIWASDCSYINKEITDFVFFAFSFLKLNQERIYDLRHGAVQQHIYPKDLVTLPLVIPPISLINQYERIVSVLHKKIEKNLIESATLNSLKEVLLPKLITGELEIPESEYLNTEVFK